MRYDVVVVGAGPAGSTAAKFLTEKGVRVLLLDKSTFPRDKPCGGGLPARVVRRYKYLEEKDLIDSYSYEACLYSSSLKHTIEIQRDEPIVAMVLRNSFDEGLANLATRSGATFLPEKTVESLRISEENARLVLTDGTKVESPYVIAADGMWSSIGKQLGENQSCKNIGVCALKEYPVQKKTLNQFFSEKRRVHIHLNTSGVVGYGWVFPKNEHVNIGICEFRQAIKTRNMKKNIKKIYENYLKILKENKIIPPTLQADNLKGGVFPTTPVNRTYMNRVLLCGDAAGFTNPLTGEGIYNAMVSGEIAAKVITKALETGATGKGAIQEYQARWKKDFGNDNRRFFHLSKHWGMEKENIVRLFGKDKNLVDLVMDHVLTLKSRKTLQWKLARRYLTVYLKDRFGLL
jgi:geranylgeranyl reductase family protein